MTKVKKLIAGAAAAGMLLAATAGPAFAIVHGVTPSNECGSSGNAGGVPAVGKTPFTPPVPADASDGSAMNSGANVPGTPLVCQPE